MSRMLTVLCVAVVVGTPGAGARQAQPEPQRPTLRSGAHYVSVDAYPTRDGRALTGLTAADFELLEDGKPQTIERIEFIDHPEWTPLADRRDPNSQRDAFALASDPKYRVFVLYLDAYHVDVAGSHRLRVPISELLDRMMGPQDLFGMLTPAQTVKDLMLGQLTQTIQEQLTRHWSWGSAGLELARPEPGETELEMAYPRDARRLIALRRLDKVYQDLEQLTALLGDLREERKNIIFFSDYLISPSVRRGDITNGDGRGGDPPRIGTSPEGTLTLGSRGAGDPDRTRLGAERARLLSLDFDLRFRELLQQARRANVSFYTVRPGGLSPNVSMLDNGYSNLQVLAEQTDGVPLVASNDLRAGMATIAADLSSHYLLGYYTANTKWDGGTRKLTVRLKSTGKAIRARREYRAPTEAEMASIRNARSGAGAASAAPSAGQAALSALARVSPSSRLNAYGTLLGSEVAIVAEIAAAEIEAGRWKQGADIDILLTGKAGEPVAVKGRIEPGSRGTVVRIPAGAQHGPWQAVVRMRGEDNVTDADTVAIESGAGTLLGKPLAYRAASAAASAYRPLAAFQFRRTERLRLEWPVGQALDSHQARLLDRTGKPIAIPLATSTRDAAGLTVLTTDLNLAPLSNGDYLIEVSAKAGDKSEQQVIAIRVSMAR